MGRDTAELWVDRGLRNMAAAWEHVARAMGGGWARWDEAWVSDAGSACPFLNNATLLRPLGGDGVPDLTARLDGFFGARSGGSWLLWSGPPAPDLSGTGYTFWGEPPLMLRPPGGDPPPFPPELRIVEAQDAAALAAFESVLVDGFPLSWLQPFRPGCLFDARVLGGPLRLFVGFVDECPVSVSMAFADAGVVGVYAVATMPDARGRGYGAALTWRAGTADPDLPAVLESSDPGRPVYERLGFAIVTRLSLWERTRRGADGHAG